jgi:hypothetical protein
VETKRLVQQVKRNIERFPDDFMFQLDRSEAAALRSQIATSNSGQGGRRYAPYAFTEQGVAMLSGVLRSKRVIAVNIEIMRVFVELRQGSEFPTDRSGRSGSGLPRTRNRSAAVQCLDSIAKVLVQYRPAG